MILMMHPICPKWHAMEVGGISNRFWIVLGAVSSNLMTSKLLALSFRGYIFALASFWEDSGGSREHPWITEDLHGVIFHKVASQEVPKSETLHIRKSKVEANDVESMQGHFET